MKPTRHDLLAVAVLAGTLCAGCGGSDPEVATAGAAAGAPGVYQLQRVNGARLATGDGQHLFVNGVLDLGEDGTWCMGIEWRGQLWSRVSADRATYTKTAGSFAFSSPEGENPSFTGSVESGRVTLSYVFGGSSDRFTFSQPTDSLTPHCDR